MQATAPDIIPYIDEQINIALSRYDFWEFCLYYDDEFFTKRTFLKEVANGFQWLYEEYKQGRSKKISISMPPRSGKSFTLSLFIAWWLGQFPELSVMRNCCTDTLYKKFSYDVRAIIRERKYRLVFPKVQLASDKQNLDGWNLSTAKQVSYFGGGVGGTIMGLGCNLAASDDLYKDIAAARSETIQEVMGMWKQSAHDSRMETNCSEIFLGTRWTKRDEIGKAIDEGRIDKEITIPALNENNESFCEDVKTTAEYLKIKDETDEEIWSAEYMQEPIEIKGLLFPASELKYFEPIAIQPDYRYCAVDPADTGGDDTSAPFCDLIGNGIYITDIIYNNHGTDETIPLLVEKLISKRINSCEIEGVSAWILFAKDVRTKVQERYQDCDIRIIKNTSNKQTRILAQSAFIKNHFYFLKEEYRNSDYKKFMKVLTSYLREGSKRDDAPDSLAMASAYFMRNFNHL